MLLKFLLVGMGGSLGAMMRYGLSQWLANETGHFPWATLTANLSGCILMGMLLGIGINRDLESYWVFLGVGILGSMTTYSAFSGETVQLWVNQHPWLAATNVVANLFGSLAACGAGYWLTRGGMG